MKYSETKANEDGWYYDWPAIIHNLRHGLATYEEFCEWHTAACDWPTCACGNQCADIPREDYGRPKDRTLSDLGEKFPALIRHIWDYRADANEAAAAADDALDCLHEIDARAAELLREMK